MGEGPRAVMQPLLCTPTAPQQPSKAAADSTKVPKQEEMSSFQFPLHGLLKSMHSS